MSENRPKRPAGDRPFEKKNERGERRPYNGEKKPYNGERRPYYGAKKAENGEGRPFEKGEGKFDGERRPYHGTKKPMDGEKRPYHGDKKPVDGEKRPYNGERKPRGPRKEKIDARKLALRALCDVTIGGAYSGIALNERLRDAEMSLEDKRLATSLFYTTLENRIRLDYVLGQFVEHMPEPFIRECLHLAAAQILYMDRIPDHAAVDEAVKQVKAYGRDQYAALVNGTLRNLIRAREAGSIEQPDRAVSAVRYLSIEHSVPETLVKRLVDAYGEEEAERIISFRPEEHWETVRPNLIDMNDGAFEKYLERRGWEWKKGLVPHSYHVLRAGDLPSDPDFRRGLFTVQGASSMLAAEALSPRNGGMLIDACAAPGGKASLLCELMQGTGRVYAYELHAHRVELIRNTAKRLRLYNMRPIQADATVLREDNVGQMDGVLLDAPCSGLGVMHNKPDIKYRLKETNIEEIVELQKRLMDTCCQYVKRGGAMVYSTCTILPEENSAQMDAFLERHPEFQLDLEGKWVPEELKGDFVDGKLQLLPGKYPEIDGFFIAKLVRKGY